MLKQVTTLEDITNFNHILANSWSEKGYPIAYVNGETDLFLFQKDDIWCATLEMKEFVKEGRTDKFPLGKLESIAVVPGTIYEIDCLSILRTFRKQKILGDLLSLILQYAIDHDAPYCVAMIEPRLFKALPNFYGVPVVSLGFVEGEEAACFDIAELKKRMHEYKWFKSPKVYQEA